jgi:hypothetical protein
MGREATAIAEVIGRDAALRLIGQAPRWPRHDRAGNRLPGEWVVLYVPSTLPPDHFLARAIGWEAASRLVRMFGGEVLQPGNCRGLYYDFRNRSIKQLHGEGVPVAQLAEWFDVSERHVRNLVAKQENPRVEQAA